MFHAVDKCWYCWRRAIRTCLCSMVRRCCSWFILFWFDGVVIQQQLQRPEASRCGRRERRNSGLSHVVQHLWFFSREAFWHCMCWLTSHVAVHMWRIPYVLETNVHCVVGRDDGSVCLLISTSHCYYPVGEAFRFSYRDQEILAHFCVRR